MKLIAFKFLAGCKTIFAKWQISLPKMVWFSFSHSFKSFQILRKENVQEIMKLYTAPIWYHPPYIYLIQGPFILVRHACTSTIQFGGTTKVWVEKTNIRQQKPLRMYLFEEKKLFRHAKNYNCEKFLASPRSL